MTIELARIELIRPDWPAPGNVQAFATTRMGGVSQHSWLGLNLASHTQDDAAAVLANRAALKHALALPSEPYWLNQVHGTAVVELKPKPVPISLAEVPVTADASFTRQTELSCAVLTADCLPVLFCDRAGTWVAAAHAGWRGLCAGILEQTLAHFPGRPAELMAWLGPAIGPDAFEVGPEVRAEFIRHDPAAANAFRVGQADRYFADIYALARQRLNALGVRAIFGGQHCTFSDPIRFYSYRRDRNTGRQASLIWLSAA